MSPGVSVHAHARPVPSRISWRNYRIGPNTTDMNRPLKIAVAGLGRMGSIHALHAGELARDTSNCELAALADLDIERARRVSADLGHEIPIFKTIEELAKADICNAT